MVSLVYLKAASYMYFNNVILVILHFGVPRTITSCQVTSHSTLVY